MVLDAWWNHWATASISGRVDACNDEVGTWMNNCISRSSIDIHRIIRTYASEGTVSSNIRNVFRPSGVIDVLRHSTKTAERHRNHSDTSRSVERHRREEEWSSVWFLALCIGFLVNPEDFSLFVTLFEIKYISLQLRCAGDLPSLFRELKQQTRKGDIAVWVQSLVFTIKYIDAVYPEFLYLILQILVDELKNLATSWHQEQVKSGSQLFIYLFIEIERFTRKIWSHRLDLSKEEKKLWPGEWRVKIVANPHINGYLPLEELPAYISRGLREYTD